MVAYLKGLWSRSEPGESPGGPEQAEDGGAVDAPGLRS